jgi:hypothetical protein
VGSLVGLPQRKVEGVRLIEADVLIVEGKNELPATNSVTPCCAGGGSCGPEGRKEVDYDLSEWIGKLYASC